MLKEPQVSAFDLEQFEMTDEKENESEEEMNAPNSDIFYHPTNSIMPFQ